MAANDYRVGVDIGGTFTDLIVVNDETGAFAVGKVLTTPGDPSQAVEAVLVETLQQAGIDAGRGAASRPRHHPGHQRDHRAQRARGRRC